MGEEQPRKVMGMGTRVHVCVCVCRVCLCVCGVSQEKFKARSCPNSMTALMPLPSPLSSATRGSCPAHHLECTRQ